MPRHSAIRLLPALLAGAAALFQPATSLLAPARASAQDAAALAAARTVADCVHREDEQMQRLMRLVAQAEQRAAQPGIAADVRRDALASIDALVEQIRSHAQRARHCIEQTRIPVRVDETVTETAPDDPRHGSLAADRGTVHEIESGTRLAASVTAVRGERVDGAGSAPDESVRAAVRSAAPRLVACYDAYLDRAARRAGEVHVSFTASDGGRVSGVVVERASAFDAAMSRCVEQALAPLRVDAQRGRSVYSYVLRFSAE